MSDQPFGLVKSEFEIVPAGKHGAVLAEISFAQVKNNFDEDKGLEWKMFWSFELREKRKDGTPFVIDIEMFPQISANNAVGKLCKGWAGSPKPLTDEQIADWIGYVMGNTTGPENVDPNPPLKGVTCILEIEHVESKKTKKDYPKVTAISPNGKRDDLGNIIRGDDGRVVPAFELTISDKYKSRAQRQAEIQERVDKKNSGGSSTPAAPKSNPPRSAIPF